MPDPPRLQVAVADLASSGRGRGSNGVAGPIVAGLMTGTAAPTGSDLSALVRGGVPSRHARPDPASSASAPGPGALGIPQLGRGDAPDRVVLRAVSAWKLRPRDIGPSR